MAKIVISHLIHYETQMKTEGAQAQVKALIEGFDQKRSENQEVATDQLLNAVFLTVTIKEAEERTFSSDELKKLRENLLQQISGTPS